MFFDVKKLHLKKIVQRKEKNLREKFRLIFSLEPLKNMLYFFSTFFLSFFLSFYFLLIFYVLKKIMLFFSLFSLCQFFFLADFSFFSRYFLYVLFRLIGIQIFFGHVFWNQHQILTPDVTHVWKWNIMYIIKYWFFLLIMIGILGVLEQDWGTCDTIYLLYKK